MASRPDSLRILPVSLIGGEAAAKAAREDLGTGSGQQFGVSVLHFPVRAPAPGPAITAAASVADTPTPFPIRALSAPGTAAVPAAIQGVGIFNLSAIS